MKSTELRLGNWVYAINRRGGIHIPENAPLKVLQVGVFNSEVLPIDINPASVTEWIVVSNVDISPIPLTEQILVEFGFEWSIYHQAYHLHSDGVDFYDIVACYPNGYQFSTFRKRELIGKPFVYVHTLQNLFFAISGTELERKAKW